MSSSPPPGSEPEINSPSEAGAPNPNAQGSKPRERQQRGQIQFQFCHECSNMLYPKEDRVNDTLMYACRTCQFSAPAASGCVYRHDMSNTVGETAGVTQDVGNDPTVSDVRFCLLCAAEIPCRRCGGGLGGAILNYDVDRPDFDHDFMEDVDKEDVGEDVDGDVDEDDGKDEDMDEDDFGVEDESIDQNESNDEDESTNKADGNGEDVNAANQRDDEIKDLGLADDKDSKLTGGSALEKAIRPDSA